MVADDSQVFVSDAGAAVLCRVVDEAHEFAYRRRMALGLVEANFAQSPADIHSKQPILVRVEERRHFLREQFNQMKLKRIWDCHCHPQSSTATFAQLSNACLDAINNVASEKVKLSVMGTEPRDWPVVEQLYQRLAGDVVPFFGLHPWLAYKLQLKHGDSASIKASWIQELSALLERYPEACVGEFGIDRLATTPAEFQLPNLPANTFATLQKDIFAQHFDVAVKYQRPCSIHLVKGDNFLMDFLKARCQQLPNSKVSKQDPEILNEKLHALFPPAIMLHSFGSSTNLINQLLKLRIAPRIWFSFSATINARSKKTVDNIKAVPEDRLLIESDVHSGTDISEAMWTVVQLVADARGWSADKTAEQCWQNACAFHEVKH